VIDLFEAAPSRANFLTAVPSQNECETNPTKKQKNAAVFGNRIRAYLKKSHIHFTHRSHSGGHNECRSQKEKIITLNVIKKFCAQARNCPETFLTIKPEPGPTYNNSVFTM